MKGSPAASMGTQECLEWMQVSRPQGMEVFSPPSVQNNDADVLVIKNEMTLKRTHADASDESSDESDLLLSKKVARIHQLPSPPAALPLVPHEPASSPPPPPPSPPAGPALPLPIRRLTLESLNNTRKRPYVVNVPYDLSFTAESSKNTCLEPAPVIGLDGKATHLSFEIASWETMWAGLNAKTRREHETSIAAKMLETGISREELLHSGPRCSGMTLQICDFWYSLACLYDANLNVGTAGPSDSKTSSHAKLLGLQGKCRGCMAHHSCFNMRLRMTFDVEEALRYKAAKLNHNEEWTTKVSKDVSFSLVLRVLRNCGFIHLRTQADVIAIRKPLTKAEQAEHLTWIKANVHHGFRTGAELILLTEAGLCMISFDRSDSNKKIDQIGQTIVADSWGFNRLSNSLSERATDQLLREILAGSYADGDAAFRRRNGEGQPRRLSEAWEASIKRKWDTMSVESQNSQRKFMSPNHAPYIDNRVWTLREFQRICRLNANSNGNLVDEISGVELSPDNWGVDRVINDRVAGVSGMYCHLHCLITHARVNDFKEAGGRKIFATVETLSVEMQHRNLVQADYRVATQLIIRDYLNQIRVFRNSPAYQENMDKLDMTKNGH
ncbi:hypothetical protein HK100_000274 [Physocladia obscura]|uniref:Uncharacterized protein n=1 Tax=Physocladia obscura TaxID=109957 RepID=A0AAD5XFB6_9FUNG|nr:hypothetical protein HK100_000274 [Physocladia obscura]